MPQILMPYTVQLDSALRVTPLSTLFARGDSNAHRFELKLMRAGVQDMLSGCKVLCKFYQISENTVVSVSGSVEDGKAIAVLTKACYEYIGRFVLTISIKSGDDETTVFYGDGYMQGQRADNAITGEYIVYDVDTLIGKISEIDAATDAADTATANANTAAENANAAATNAQSKASLADTAAQGASGWANATMTATGLPAGSAPTAKVTTAADGSKIITLGIPRGDTGATPQISVEVSTGAAGSEASVSVTGTAENPVIHLTIPRGDTGAIENLTINGKTPDASGTVTLTAEDVGARPDTWMPTAEDVGALPTDGTAADSAKLGGKAPEYYIQPRNLLDNSDFRNPVNQRGFVSGNEVASYAYFIDRWTAYNTACVVTISDSGLSSGSEYVRQILIKSRLIGKNITFAVCTSDGTILTANAEIPSTSDWENLFNSTVGGVHIVITNDSATTFFVRFSTGDKTVKWAALYEGSYTADTLPPYVPKGYAAELAECQRYYLKLPYNYTFLYGNSGASDGSGMRLILPVPATMRINPTVSSFVLNFSLNSGVVNNVTYTPSSAIACPNCISFYGSTSSAISSSPTYINVLAQLRNTDLELIADL